MRTHGTVMRGQSQGQAARPIDRDGLRPFSGLASTAARLLSPCCLLVVLAAVLTLAQSSATAEEQPAAAAEKASGDDEAKPSAGNEEKKNDSAAKDEEKGEEEAEEEPDPYALPEGEDVDELLAFLRRVQTLRPRTIAEAIAHQQKGRAALREAAERILKLEKDKTTEAHRAARLVLLEERVRELGEADADQRRAVLAEVKKMLKTRQEEGLTPAEVRLALMVTRTLEYGDDAEMAAEASESFGRILAKSDDESIARMGARLQGAARRIRLPGRPMKIEGTTVQGEKFDWEAYRGKLVLIDFWATWCGPCRAETPNMKERYRQYHDRGFEIVGISVDADREALEEYLEKEEIPWTTLHEKEGEGGHPVADYYGVSGIPTMILVDKEGKVLSVHARGPELNRLLEEQLGPAEPEEMEDKDRDAEPEDKGQEDGKDQDDDKAEV